MPTCRGRVLVGARTDAEVAHLISIPLISRTEMNGTHFDIGHTLFEREGARPFQLSARCSVAAISQFLRKQPRAQTREVQNIS